MRWRERKRVRQVDSYEDVGCLRIQTKGHFRAEADAGICERGGGSQMFSAELFIA